LKGRFVLLHGELCIIAVILVDVCKVTVNLRRVLWVDFELLGMVVVRLPQLLKLLYQSKTPLTNCTVNKV